ncbi:hypothetical protein HPB48_000598 [Haemaphysalis longicornis]|uniref:PPM-type phosphatase domain-containing protein n=1 Tax=Haemaphysalis longicornis TaxID=44386 RepID=A0A9J6FV32_HAELO|nr:hypothetical protein HPB48_000598 [Haemaphysalis longicornis]
MPTLRDKLADFLRQLSTGTERTGADPKPECPSPTSATATFMQRYLNGEGLPKQPEIVHSKSCYDLPNRDVAPLSKRILAAYTGPSGGLTQVNRGPMRALTVTDQVDFIDDDSLCGSNENLASRYLDRSGGTPKAKAPTCLSSKTEGPRVADTACVTGEEAETATEEVAGVSNWCQPAEFAYGIATTLYECHPVTKENAGEPIADSFAICVRENSAVLALADGVNWGDKSCLAARCAVHGCVDYLNRALYREGGTIDTTQEVFVCLLRSFQAAHSLILQEQGMLTTLCAAVAVQLRGSDQYVVCVCNVGDSLAYVYSQQHGVREITLGSHDIHSMRDMRDALGALGPVDGQNPELNNLTVSMTQAWYQGDGACSSAKTSLTAAKRRILEDHELSRCRRRAGRRGSQAAPRAGPRLACGRQETQVVADTSRWRQKGGGVGTDVYDGREDRANRNVPTTPSQQEDYPDNLPLRDKQSELSYPHLVALVTADLVISFDN